MVPLKLDVACEIFEIDRNCVIRIVIKGESILEAQLEIIVGPIVYENLKIVWKQIKRDIN